MSALDDILEQELDDTLDREYARKNNTVRCAALINPESASLIFRSHMSPLSRRCRRRAAAQEGSHWFCRQHAPMWKTHYQILDRIMEITVRRD